MAAVKLFQGFIPADMGNASVEVDRCVELAWMMLLRVALLFAGASCPCDIISACQSALRYSVCNHNPFILRWWLMHQNGHRRRQFSFKTTQGRNVALAFQHVLIAKQLETSSVVLRLCKRLLDMCEYSELGLPVREATWYIFLSSLSLENISSACKHTSRAIQACPASKLLWLTHAALSPATTRSKERADLIFSLLEAPVYLYSDAVEAMVLGEQEVDSDESMD